MYWKVGYVENVWYVLNGYFWNDPCKTHISVRWHTQPNMLHYWKWLEMYAKLWPFGKKIENLGIFCSILHRTPQEILRTFCNVFNCFKNYTFWQPRIHFSCFISVSFILLISHSSFVLDTSSYGYTLLHISSWWQNRLHKWRLFFLLLW